MSEGNSNVQAQRYYDSSAHNNDGNSALADKNREVKTSDKLRGVI